MTMISLDDSAWSRSYAVWSQLVVELPLVTAGSALSACGQDTLLADLRIDDRADPALAAHPQPALA